MRSALSTFAQALRSAWREPTVRVPGVPSGSARTAGDPLPYNDPREQATYVSKKPIRFPLTLPVQNLRNGLVIPQSGFGRPVIPATLGIAPVQSLTQMPDGRIIARPMPTAGVDSRQVIK